MHYLTNYLPTNLTVVTVVIVVKVVTVGTVVTVETKIMQPLHKNNHATSKTTIYLKRNHTLSTYQPLQNHKTYLFFLYFLSTLGKSKH